MVLAEVVTVPNFSALTSHSTYLLNALLAIWFMLTLPSEESPSIFLSTSRSIRNVLVTVSGDLRVSIFGALSVPLVKKREDQCFDCNILQTVCLHTRRKTMPCIQAR